VDRKTRVRLLIDTCAFLWIVGGASEPSTRARELFVDPNSEVYMSVVSAWEIALKHAAGLLPLSESPERFVPAERRRHGIDTLGLDEETAPHLEIGRLSPLHRDPFDRMLVCQAIVHGLVIVGPDPLITQYPIRAPW
jgi:PIN domain nuclease of toxin-antitoxin system